MGVEEDKMKYGWVLFLCALFALLLLAGCNLNTPVCANASLQAPNLMAPQDHAITNNLTPPLSWSYPDPNCHPESYHITLLTVADAPEDLSGTANGYATNWGPASPLDPGKEYEWAVRSKNGSFPGPQSQYRFFYTGPMCATAALHAPIPDYPDHGVAQDILRPLLTWHYPDPCLPEGYRIDISADPSFADTSLSGGTGNPSMTWMPAQELTNCSVYFWRVAAINGTTLGPYSEVAFFQTDDWGDCDPLPHATVRGSLWFDQCSVPLDASPVPDPLPAGCVLDSYGVDADGIHQPGEPDMLNITVNMGPGDCPAGGPMSTITNINGIYTFSNLEPGKYCLNVDAASFLGPGGTGHWTVIPSGHEGNTYRSIIVTAGQLLNGQDFAWYQFTGGPTPTPTPAQGLSFTPDKNVNCRTGPDRVFGVLDVAMKGQPYPVDGRTLDGSWLRIMLTKTRGCWVLTDTGKASADLSGVRVLISPPTPTPTPVPPVDCSTYKDQNSCLAQPACQWKKLPSTAASLYQCTDK